jgi:hypothetical protein
MNDLFWLDEALPTKNVTLALSDQGAMEYWSIGVLENGVKPLEHKIILIYNHSVKKTICMSSN